MFSRLKFVIRFFAKKWSNLFYKQLMRLVCLLEHLLILAPLLVLALLLPLLQAFLILAILPHLRLQQLLNPLSSLFRVPFLESRIKYRGHTSTFSNLKHPCGGKASTRVFLVFVHVWRRLDTSPTSTTSSTSG